MLETVRQTIQKFQLIPQGHTVVVGVSGGADSLTLLHILSRLAARMKFHIHAATLDHQLRGEESTADARFVEGICHKWIIPVTVGKVDVAAMMRDQSLGVETAARLARYHFLAQIAHDIGAQRIVVAHHADDQAETVLMRLLRGVGTHGLAGMSLESPLPYHPGLILIRPLLKITRLQIESYCRQNNLVPREDSTNQDSTLLRNAIRHDVLPYLARFSPNLSQVLNRLAENAFVDDAYLNQELMNFTSSKVVSVTNDRVTVNRSAFCVLHPAMQRRLMIWSLEQLGITENFGHDRILEAVEIGKRGHQGARSLLGNDVHLRVEYEYLHVENSTVLPDTHLPLLTHNMENVVLVPGVTSCDAWSLQTSLTPIAGEMVGRIAVSPDSSLTLRPRREGDHFSPLGMRGHTQKLNRWMINRKISVAVRDRVPLLCVGERIAAICLDTGWIIGEAFAVNDNSTHIIYFQFLDNL